MSLKNVRLIFLREVRDQLRDRRTLFMVAVLPMLLYPALSIGMAQMMMAFSEQARNVVILGASELEANADTLPPLYAGSKFLPMLFADPMDADRLHLTTDGVHATGEMSEADRERIDAARSQTEAIYRLADIVRQRTELETVLTAYNLATASGLQIVDPGAEEEESMPTDDESAEASPATTEGEPIDRAALEARILELQEAEEEIKSNLTTWFRGSDIQVLVVIPEGFAESLRQQTARLVNREPTQEIPHPIVLQNSADEKSQIAYRRVREAIDNWEHIILQSQLSAAGLPESIDKPVDPTRIDLAQGEQISASLWSKLFPVLLVIMAVTGAFYPAIDLGAGEKERGTMETLLICPATRAEIVLGKFFTVMLFSISTALLNIACMAVTGRHMISSSMAQAGNNLLGAATFPPLSSLAWLVVLAVPLSALFSSLSLAFAMFARSSKEGQYYLTPLLVVTMGLTFFCLNPGIEIDPFKSVMPVVGPALLLKSLLLTTGNAAELLVYAVPVLVSSVAYSALGLWWAIEVFSKESVLFREAERFDLRLWIAHIFRDKDATPSFTEAAFCIVLILLLQFAAIPVLQRGFADAIQSGNSIEVLNLQTIYLIATVGTPAVMMGLLLTTHFHWTLKLHWPAWPYLAVALVLPFTLQPISVQLLQWLDWFFPPLPQGAEYIMRAVSDAPIWWPLLAIALTPAICEELAFRGFILSGLQRSGRHWLAIMISAMVFGLIHLVPQQQFNGALLGIVIGLLAVRSGSLLPGVLFHFLFNGTQVMLTRLPESALDKGVLPKLVYVENNELLATWPTLAVCAVVSTALIFWLVKQSSAPATPGAA
jgi:sodium transport system permease protein